MILALGKFSSQSVFNAALAMSEGILSGDDHPIRRHPNGWGAIWKDESNPYKLSIYRDTRSLKESLETTIRFQNLKTDFLAVHVRHATLTHNQGLECTHPITREGTTVPWYLLHNGFLPTVYKKLGLSRSVFDSGEYFDYIIPQVGDKLDEPSIILAKLEALEPGGSSANAIVVNPLRTYVINWFPEDTPFRRYFTMHKCFTEDATFISSEIVPALGTPENWSFLSRGQILEFSL